MKKSYLCLFLFFILSGTKLFAQNATIRGLITDEYNNPVANVKVVLAGTAFETTTEANGSFHFDAIPFGQYTVEIKEADYAAFSQKADATQQLLDLGKLTLLPEGRKNP